MQDAVDEVKNICNYIAHYNGRGEKRGVVREVCDMIIEMTRRHTINDV